MAPLTLSPDSLTFIGTATTVLRLGPFTLLTDPNFLHRGQYAYLGKGLFSRRLTDPACEIEHLPTLDAVVLSHLHGDHWDRVAQRGLDRTTPVLTTPNAARTLSGRGFTNSVGLVRWQRYVLPGTDATLTVTALPAQHARGFAQRLLPTVMGSMLELVDERGTLRIYVSGDTVLVDELDSIRLNFPPPDVAVLHLGGTTLPGGLLVTMNGEQGADLLETIQPRLAVPVHHSDYGVFRSPVTDFLRAAHDRGFGPQVRHVAPGEEVGLRA